MSNFSNEFQLVISGGAGALAGAVLMFLRELLTRPQLLAEAQKTAQITASDAVREANRVLLDQIIAQGLQISAQNAQINDLQQQARVTDREYSDIRRRAAAHEVVLRKIVSAFNGRDHEHQTEAIQAAIDAVRDLDQLDLHRHT